MNSNPKPAAVEVIDLRKTYANGFTALKGLNLRIEQGDFFALLGPNGAGKSTTIGIITSLIKKTAGQVRVLGYDLDRDTYQAQIHVGAVPQEFNFSVFEKPIDIVTNQAGFYGLKYPQARKNAEHYLRKLALWDVHNQQARNLSGGMKRRLMIARAMVHEPSILILDEPTAGVDLEIRRSMWEFVTQINREFGTTIILTTHYLEEAEQLCKNVAIINHGDVMMQMGMKALLSKLDVETLILDAEKLTGAQQIHLKQANLPFDLSIQDELTLSVDIYHHQSLNDLFALLSEQGVVVKSMRNKTNRLEELFLRELKK